MRAQAIGKRERERWAAGEAGRRGKKGKEVSPDGKRKTTQMEEWKRRRGLKREIARQKRGRCH